MLRWIHGKQQQQPIIFRPVPVRGDRDPDLLCHGWDRQHDGYRWVFVNAFMNSISEPLEKELLEYVCFPNFLFLFYNLFALFFSVDNIIINRKLISLLLILIFDMSFRIYVYTLYNWKCIERKKDIHVWYCFANIEMKIVIINTVFFISRPVTIQLWL